MRQALASRGLTIVKEACIRPYATGGRGPLIAEDRINMAKTLLIVESPTKARTLSRYLGPDYVVKASMGHVKDLPRHKMGVDVDGDFTPEYRVIEGKHKIIRELKEAAEGVDRIYLAPDPDREGEAIAWHIAEILNGDNRDMHRVLFNEITRKGVQEGLDNPLPLDRSKFESQQARRILDRLVGYEISPILWKKVKGGLSAGRVQSVALRIIVDRENEIRSFVPVEYWHLFCTLHKQAEADGKAFVAQLTHVDGQKAVVSGAEQAKAIQAHLESASFCVLSVKQSERSRKPPAPYITSKLQQEATRRLRLTARKVMQVAQQLYEGIDLGEAGSVGLITYMRTDSTRLSAEAVDSCRGYIAGKYGEDQVPRSPNVFPQKKGAQGAHEAIRPTSMAHPPESVRPHLSKDQMALYTLIWNRFVACQMKPAVYATTQVRIDARPRSKEPVYELRVTGSTLLYPGWLAVEDEEGSRSRKAKSADDEAPDGTDGAEGLQVEELPVLTENEPLALRAQGVDAQQKFTKPPARYTEGALIKELEDKGIGRPSTYASIISTIQDRRYVKKFEQKFTPTPLGEIVLDRLRSHFPDILDIDFTARMEEKLDEIESGRVQWSRLLGEFYGPFHETVIEALKTMKNGVDSQEYEKFSALSGPTVRIEVNLTCTSCGKPMVLRGGRYGEFLSCSGFPKCRESRPVHTGVACPREGCGGEVVERRANRGRKFYGCSKHEENGCDFVTWAKPLKKACPKCGAPFIVIKRARGASFLTCVAEGCDYSEEISL